MATRSTRRAQQKTPQAAADEGILPPVGAVVGSPVEPGQTLPPNNTSNLSDDEVAKIKAGEPQHDVESGRNPGNVERGADNQERSVEPGQPWPHQMHADFRTQVGPAGDKGSEKADHNLASTYLDPSEMKAVADIPGDVQTWLPDFLNALTQRAYAAGQASVGFKMGTLTTPSNEALLASFERGRAQGRKDASPQQ